MLQFPDHAREMRKGEEDAVDALLRAAFETAGEANLVKNLRKSGQIAGETVLPIGDRIVGYYALSHMVAPKSGCVWPLSLLHQMFRDVDLEPA